MRVRGLVAVAGALVLSVTAAACSSSPSVPTDGSSSSSAASPSASSQGSASGDETCAGVMDRAECALLGRDVSPRQRGSWGWQDAAVVPARGSGSDTALRVRYPEGSSSQTSMREDGTPTGGAQAYLPLDAGSVDAAHLTYLVRFARGFEFNKGGKLPGLYGGTRTSGGRTPDGTDGFSTRLMWRTGGAGEIYAYLPSSQVHGTSLGRGAWTFEPDRWYRIDQEVRLNDVGRKNGTILLDVDGERVLSERGLEFRTEEDLQIDGLFFSTFFGGADATWGSPRDQYADFTGFRLVPLLE